MLSLSKCPRCNGRVLLDKDLYGWYIECLHCGYQRIIEEKITQAKRNKSSYHLASGAVA